ncbi:MAG: GNAT family N-acetyltransferase, partial [Anaerolineae bacterium]|nr:GNAT family N-acetyltransferase [Anaerolineae bacterium]
MSETVSTTDLIRDLGDGLILRHGSPADAESLSMFNARIHSDDGPDQPEEVVYHWTHDLLARPHPTLSPRDFTVVEEATTGRIVSSCNLIPQTWAYDGIPFGVGRVELVGTLPEYRKRGLIRAQFEVLHRWSAERGHLAQAITGIGYFYRQFGYEMPLNLSGTRRGSPPYLPRLKPDETEPVNFRDASEADFPFLAGLYDHACRRSPVCCVKDEGFWRYELTGRTPKNAHFRRWQIIERPDGEPVGYLAYPDSLWGTGMFGTSYELVPGASWLDVTPAVIRRLWTVGQQIAERDSTPEKPRKLEEVGFGLGGEHPAYQAAG